MQQNIKMNNGVNCEERLLGFVLNQTNKILQQYINTVLNNEGVDITIEQWPILMLLTYYPGITQQQLAVEINRDKTTVTRLVNNMVRKGLLERSVDENDRRKNRILVTPQGDRVRENVFKIFASQNSGMLDGISKEDYETTMSVMLRIVGNVGQQQQLKMIHKHMDNIRNCFTSK